MRFTLIIGLLSFLSFAQAQQDTSLILHENEFLQIVAKNHPLIKKSELIERKGDLNLLQSRGGFDPYFYNYFNQKQYDEKNYYSILNGGLKIPTWYGVEGKLNYDNTSGYYLNPENTNPSSGLVSAGVSVSLGKGLFIDERRKTLEQAKIYQNLSQVEQFNAINNLLYESVKTYWNWVISYNHLKIYQNSVDLARSRFEGVKKNFYHGAEPAIDTLEAYIQLQNRQYSYNQAQIELIESTLILSNYLWSENLEPLELSEKITAPEILDEFHNYIKSDNDNSAYSDFTLENHPQLKAYDYKLSSLEIEKKYKAEALKPKLNLNYNFLTSPVSDSPFSNFSNQNYKIGVEFGIPLLFRQQRGDFQLSKVKLIETEYDQKQKTLEIKNKVEYYYQEIKNLEIQEKLVTKNTVNYERLLGAEKRKFEIGESSLFLINSREIKVIESQVKLIDIRGKYQKAHASLTYSTGTLLR